MIPSEVSIQFGALPIAGRVTPPFTSGDCARRPGAGLHPCRMLETDCPSLDSMAIRSTDVRVSGSMTEWTKRSRRSIGSSRKI